MTIRCECASPDARFNVLNSRKAFKIGKEKEKMTKRVVSMLLVLCLVLAMATGCSSGQASDPADAAAISETRVFVDSAKREVEVPTEVTRIVPAGTLAQIALLP